MAPRVGLEPTAYRLTAGCSTIELPWNIGGDIQIRTGDQGVAVHCLTTWLCRHASQHYLFYFTKLLKLIGVDKEIRTLGLQSHNLAL